MLREVDAGLRKLFKQSRSTSTDELPSISEFVNFLEEECSQLESANLTNSNNSLAKNTVKPIPKQTAQF